MTEQTIQNLQGTISSIRFHNQDNGYCIFSLISDDTGLDSIVTGVFPAVRKSEHISCTGSWVTHPKYGDQFKADLITVIEPVTAAAMEKYLASGAIDGIGVILAKKLIEKYGDQTFDIIENKINSLMLLPGVGKVKARKIQRSWRENRANRELNLFFAEYDIGPSLSQKIIKTFGQSCAEVVKTNPYLLSIRIQGVGFKTADRIAMSSGLARDSAERIGAGLVHCLREQQDRGHCAVEADNLIDATMKLLTVDIRAKIADVLAELISDTRLVTRETVPGETLVYLPSLYDAEKMVASRLLTILNEPKPDWQARINDDLIDAAQKAVGLALNEKQLQAVKGVLSSKVYGIIGGAGVGKTATLGVILKTLELAGKKIHVRMAAPTGMAAKRMSVATDSDASTIHRLLSYDPQSGGFLYGEDNPIQADVIVIDEFSMIDLLLGRDLLLAMPDEVCFIFVGDCGQIESIGPGALLRDMLASEVIPYTELTEIQRRSKHSTININARAIADGRMPDITNDPKGDFFFIETEEEAIPEKINHIVSRRAPERYGVDPVSDIQVLSPMYKGTSGINHLNKILQATLNPHATPSDPVEFFEQDKVLSIENDYGREIVNGDSGLISQIRTIDDKKTVTVDFQGRLVDFDGAALNNIKLSYAHSIHKSQGSEYPIVVIPTSMSQYIMLNRNLLFTAVTRAKSVVILIGSKKAFKLAIDKAAEHRRTSLSELLRPSLFS